MPRTKDETLSIRTTDIIKDETMKTEINVIVDKLLAEWGVGRMSNREFWTEFAIEAARRAVAARDREYTKPPTTGSASIADL